ncbi:MAG: hypothetical protein ACXV4B_04745 [Halobacteriota archaeon]
MNKLNNAQTQTWGDAQSETKLSAAARTSAERHGDKAYYRGLSYYDKPLALFAVQWKKISYRLREVANV